MSVGDYCRIYRMVKRVTLQKLDENAYPSLYSNFESGRSQNLKHLSKYLELADSFNEGSLFMEGLANALRKGVEHE